MKRLPRWKKEQLRDKRKRFLKAFQFFFILAIIIFIASSFFIFFSISQLSLFSKSERTNFVLTGTDITLISLSSSHKDITIVSIPPDLFVNLPPPYAQYRIGSIFDLDQAENKKGELFLFAISTLMGIPVEKQWHIPSSVRIQSSLDVKNYFSLTNSLRLLKDPLSAVEYIQVWRYLHSIRLSDIRFITLDDRSFMMSEKLPDGSFNKTIDTSQMDYFMSETFFDPKFIKEKYILEVKNGTNIPGLGILVGRFLTMSGLDVVSVSTGDVTSFETKVCIFKQELKSSYTARRLTYLYNGILAECPEVHSRADIVLVLGRNYIGKWQ